jgi:hypothetical protein
VILGQILVQACEHRVNHESADNLPGMLANQQCLSQSVRMTLGASGRGVGAREDGGLRHRYAGAVRLALRLAASRNYYIEGPRNALYIHYSSTPAQPHYIHTPSDLRRSEARPHFTQGPLF